MVMFKRLVVLAVLAVLVLPHHGRTDAYDRDPQAPSKVTFHKERLVIERANGGRFGFTVEVADTEPKRQLGLMHRRKLDHDKGMLFVFYREQYVAMWMKNTYVPLDMLFIDKQGMVVDIFEKATPLSTDMIDTDVPVQYVLELAAGRVEALGLAPGDKIIRGRRLGKGK